MMASKDLVLFGFAKRENEPSFSFYCHKLETFFRMTGTSYKHQATNANAAPKGKLPYINHDGKVVADSHFCIRYCIENGLCKDLDAGLSASQRADSRAWQTYLEELVYVCVVRERWFINENYNVIYEEALGGVPWMIRPALGWYLRRSIMNSIYTAGVGRHSEEEVESIMKRAVDDLDSKVSSIGDNYFHGTDEPTEIDAIVYGFISNALQTYSNPRTACLILAKPSLVQYTKRITLKYFPEYHPLLERIEKLT
eukprot:TRINITY_DN7474_c0_g1_i1.p1 TRINITY_DN7474_c0_g1~~TRINITY_DN7474_c0_g1_i1.p1  ORF type:complete len:254 (+),score=81.45 TRINITY_DN7474_c0_g1_i1:59-820(+)